MLIIKSFLATLFFSALLFQSAPAIKSRPLSDRRRRRF